MSWRVKGKKCQKPLIFFRLRKSRYFFFLLFLENCRLTSLYTLYLLTTTTRSTKVKISWPTCQKISFSSYLWDFSSLLVIYLRKNAEKTHKWVKILPNDILEYNSDILFDSLIQREEEKIIVHCRLL